MYNAGDLLDSLRTVAWMDAEEQKHYFDNESDIDIKSSMEGLYLIVLGCDVDTIIGNVQKYKDRKREMEIQAQREEVKMLAERIGVQNLRILVDELLNGGDA